MLALGVNLVILIDNCTATGAEMRISLCESTNDECARSWAFRHSAQFIPLQQTQPTYQTHA